MEDIEKLFKVPVAIKQDQKQRGWVYLTYMESDTENRKRTVCCLNGDSRAEAMEHRVIGYDKYRYLEPIPLADAQKWLKKFCEHYRLDSDRFILVTKFPHRQMR